MSPSIRDDDRSILIAIDGTDHGLIDWLLAI